MSTERSPICSTPACQRPAVFWSASDPNRGSQAEALCSVCRGQAAMQRPQRYAPAGYGSKVHEYVVGIMDARERGTLRPLADEAIDSLHENLGCPDGCDMRHGARPTEEEWRAANPEAVARAGQQRKRLWESFKERRGAYDETERRRAAQENQEEARD